jgi:hypothetical protein
MVVYVLDGQKTIAQSAKVPIASLMTAMTGTEMEVEKAYYTAEQTAGILAAVNRRGFNAQGPLAEIFVAIETAERLEAQPRECAERYEHCSSDDFLRQLNRLKETLRRSCGELNRGPATSIIPIKCGSTATACSATLIRDTKVALDNAKETTRLASLIYGNILDDQNLVLKGAMLLLAPNLIFLVAASIAIALSKG